MPDSNGRLLSVSYYAHSLLCQWGYSIRATSCTGSSMTSLNFLYWEQHVEPLTGAILVPEAEVQLDGSLFKEEAVKLDLALVRLVGD